jgi:hypothetical protein
MSPLVTARELWWMSLELSELRYGPRRDQKWSQCLGRLVRYHPVTASATVSQEIPDVL